MSGGEKPGPWCAYPCDPTGSRPGADQIAAWGDAGGIISGRLKGMAGNLVGDAFGSGQCVLHICALSQYLPLNPADMILCTNTFHSVAL